MPMLPLTRCDRCLCCRWHIVTEAYAAVDTSWQRPMLSLTHRDRCLCCRWHIATEAYAAVDTSWQMSMLPLTQIDTGLCCRWHIVTEVYVAVDTSRQRPMLPLTHRDRCLCCRWHIVTEAYAAVDTSRQRPMLPLTHRDRGLCCRWHIETEAYAAVGTPRVKCIACFNIELASYAEQGPIVDATWRVHVAFRRKVVRESLWGETGSQDDDRHSDRLPSHEIRCQLGHFVLGSPPSSCPSPSAERATPSPLGWQPVWCVLLFHQRL